MRDDRHDNPDNRIRDAINEARRQLGMRPMRCCPKPFPPVDDDRPDFLRTRPRRQNRRA